MCIALTQRGELCTAAGHFFCAVHKPTIRCIEKLAKVAYDGYFSSELTLSSEEIFELIRAGFELSFRKEVATIEWHAAKKGRAKDLQNLAQQRREILTPIVEDYVVELCPKVRQKIDPELALLKENPWFGLTEFLNREGFSTLSRDGKIFTYADNAVKGSAACIRKDEYLGKLESLKRNFPGNSNLVRAGRDFGWNEDGQSWIDALELDGFTIKPYKLFGKTLAYRVIHG